jgi:6-phosphofructokinase
MNTKNTGSALPRKIAINVGGGFVPGMSAVIMGAALAAHKLGWEVVGIRDGFAGVLNPEHYPDGGLIPLTPQRIQDLDPSGGNILGQSPRVDPFNVRHVDEDGFIQEVDMSDRLLAAIKEEKIDAVITAVGARGMSILYKLQLKGLNVVCIPRSVENDIAVTKVSFGFNSALSFTIEMLDRVRQAAQSAHKIGVVEVLGKQSGWLALQSAIAVGADAVLIPEIPADLDEVAAHLKKRVSVSRPFGLVVVAEGAQFISREKSQRTESSYKVSLSPLATGDSSDFVISESGKAANTVANSLQLRIAEETFPLVLSPWTRGNAPTAVDRQLGIAYGAGAVQALEEGLNGVMVTFGAPKLDFIPLIDAINKVRTVPEDSDFLKVARSIGISLGRKSS